MNVQANTWIELGMTTIMLAAAKKTTAIVGSPVANMWWAHTPKPMNATSSSASATSGNASIVRRANVGMIDVAIPNAGSTMMYTSGWPKIQNRCCQSSGSPPCATSKKWKPALRWSSRKTRSTVSGGSAKISENDVARIAKQKSGIRFSDIPGARSLKIVTTQVDRASRSTRGP